MANNLNLGNILQNPGLNHIGTTIFSYLDLQSLLNCQLVSKHWKHFIEQDKIIWKQQVQNCWKINTKSEMDLRFLQKKKFPGRFQNEITQLIEELKADKELVIKLKLCNAMLIHVSKCIDINCQERGCIKMKKTISHHRNCKEKWEGGCRNSKQLIAFLCCHAKVCKDDNCLVYICKKIKQKLSRERLPINFFEILRKK